MSCRNTALARIMQMGDETMVEPSSNPDLAGFNLLTKVMVKLTKALPKGPAQEVQPSWVDTWMLAAEILFMFARHTEGLGYKARMLMHDVKVIVCGEVKCTGLLVKRELHRRTGGWEWEVLVETHTPGVQVVLLSAQRLRPNGTEAGIESRELRVMRDARKTAGQMNSATANPRKLLLPTSFTSDCALQSVRLFTDPRAHVLRSCPSRRPVRKRITLSPTCTQDQRTPPSSFLLARNPFQVDNFAPPS
ncbi:hypothetical protein PAXRUDRAFT_16718 [Paxillus rubicundulus Ve08.2h10]|uniref:Uncharacterized protein n=1 Tax=Paxillus rubicundulus Ve08.2h10 TaxID=930991 RepID=A0A0D0D524_9AGAM|nr:hypothetical protein PAXRUDRAFT_16718 [Paxillus rubicundulus Ve08.2h10]